MIGREFAHIHPMPSSFISACHTARLAVLPVISAVEKPGVPFATRKPPTLPSSSRGQIKVMSAK